MAENIILIGFMAAGKSSVGQMLASNLGWNFLDTDREIERITGATVAELFRKYGEVRFRAEESLLIGRLADIRHTVIATGGGMVLNPENWARLEDLGILIHLYVPLEIALGRVKKRRERPLLAGNQNEIQRLWLERQEIYNKATVRIDTSGKDVAEVAAEILIQLKGGCIDNGAKN